MNQPSSVTGQFFAPLHGLRGIAVLYVVISHLGNAGLFLLPAPHDKIGKVGVWIFFALSAFLLTSRLYRELETTSSRISTLLAYLVHRIFRIYPLYVVVLTGHALLGDITVPEIIKHLLLFQGWHELWAIPVEFQYYFVIPVVCIVALYLLRRYVNLLLTVAMTAALIYGATRPESVFSNALMLIPKLGPFLLGSMLALLIYGKVWPQRKPQMGFSLLISLICVVGLLATTVLYRYLAKDWLSNLFAPWLSIAIGVSVVGLIYSALRWKVIATLLGVRPLVFLGEISFSVYLIHTFIIGLVQKASGLPSVTQAWLSVALCILCASVSYWAIELPGIRAGKIIGNKIRTVASQRCGG